MTTDAKFDLELIKLIRERKCLFEAKSRRAENIEKRVAEWQLVGATLRKPVIDCKRRWNSLRDRFVKEKKKMELGQVQPGYGNEWEFYDEMKFIVPYIKLKRAKRIFRGKDYKSIIKPELPIDIDYTNSIDEDDEEDAQSLVSEDLSFSESFDVKPETVQQIHHTESHASLNGGDESGDHISVNDACYEVEEPLSSFEKKASIITSSVKGFVPDSNDGVMDLINSIKLEMKKVIHEEKDETDLFLDFMGMKMKKLSAISKLKIQTEFMQRVTEELIKESHD